MSFDPIQEDCLRLVLEALRRERIHPIEGGPFAERAMDAFHENPESLVRTDRDRSFHLTAQAAEKIDYRAPFLPDAADADALVERAASELREATELDPGNWDARRMLVALESEGGDGYVTYLLEHRDEVRRDLEERTAAAADAFDREYVGDLGRRPYLRWLAALASRAVIAGRYRLALDTAEESLAFEPADPAGVRHTGTLALAKLEATRDELRAFRRRHAAAYAAGTPRARRHHLAEKRPDAWTLLAEMSAAYRSLDLTGAEASLRALVQSCPHAAESLFYQVELPDGVFARMDVEPGSPDELVIALSEATPLLQEGAGAPDDACFSVWVSEHELVQGELDREAARDRARQGTRRMGGEN